MHTLTIYGIDRLSPDEGVDYPFPGAWHECTIGQLATIAALTSAPRPPAEDAQATERAEAHLRLALLRELSAMPVKAFTALEPTDLLTVVLDDIGAERITLLPQLDWCMAPPCYAKSMLPTVAVRKGIRRIRYQGPTDKLGRFTLLQWGFCDRLLGEVLSTGSDEAMNNFLGALYHEEGRPWCNQRIEARGAVLAHLDDRTKLAAVLNYQALRADLATSYPRAFRGGKADPYGMQGMVVRMAGEKFGTTEATGRANIHDALIHIEQSITDAEELKQRPGNN